MPAPANLVYEVSTTTGTSDFTLAAVNGKQRFSDAFGTGGSDVFDYFISSRSAAEYERGTGHMSDANTLVRDTVIESTNSNAAVDFAAGTKDVTNDIPAATQVMGPGAVTDGQAALFNGTGGNLLKTGSLIGEASNITALRLTTNAQAFRIYNTFTDTSNYERLSISWSSNIINIGPEAAGSGALRQMRLPLGAVTVSTPLLITQTWNGAAVTFTGLTLNITNTASGATSALMDLQVGGSTRFYFINSQSSGNVLSRLCLSGTNATGIAVSGGGELIFFRGTGQELVMTADHLFGWSDFGFAWGNKTNDGTQLANVTKDIGLARSAAGIVEINNGTAGTFRDLRTRSLLTPMTSELTIASGVVTVTGGYHRIDTEADAASDDLDTINGGVDGMRLVLRAENTARTIVVKDGTGNIQGPGDMSLDNTQDTVELIYDATLTAWLVISRSDNGA